MTGTRERTLCPDCGADVMVSAKNGRGDDVRNEHGRYEKVIGRHRVPGPGRPAARAVCSGSGRELT